MRGDERKGMIKLPPIRISDLFFLLLLFLLLLVLLLLLLLLLLLPPAPPPPVTASFTWYFPSKSGNALCRTRARNSRPVFS